MMSTPKEGIPLVIVTYQDIYLWVAKQREGLGDAYQQHSAKVQLSPADLKRLGLNDGALVELKNKAGSVVVKAKSDPICQQEGTGYMPASLYSNRLASYNPSVSRLPNLKRIEVRAVPTEKDITPISDLLLNFERSVLAKDDRDCLRM
jgi:formylmethanofuran dehydrogenase subunit D